MTLADVAHGPDDSHPPPWARLWRLARAEREDLQVVAVYAAGVGLLSLAVPVCVAALVNTVTFGVMLQPLVVLSGLVVACLVFEAIMATFQFHGVEMIQRRVFVRVAMDFAHRLPQVRAASLAAAGGPALVHRFFDVLTVQKTAAALLLDGLAVALQTLAGALLLAFYHPALLAFDAVLVAAVLTVLFPLGRGAVARSIAESRAKYDTAAWLDDLARNPRSFRDGDARRFAAARAEGEVRGYLDARAAHYAVVLRQHVASHAFKALLSVALLSVGGYLVIARQLTVGQLAAAELIVSAVVAGMAKFGKQLDGYYDLVTALDKIGHVHALPLERVGGVGLPPRARRGAALALEDASYGALRGCNLALRPGARAAVIAGSGEGKSLLAEVLVGLRALSSGVARVDGVDLRELSLDALRAEVAVAGEAEVFDGTVAENVAVGRASVTADRVRACLDAAGLTRAVAALPDGASTRLASGGAALSASQRARLMLARAMAGAPRLLVLDGALDALDADALREVLPALLDADAPWTLLTLTRREDVAMCCGEVYALRDGALHATAHTLRRGGGLS